MTLQSVGKEGLLWYDCTGVIDEKGAIVSTYDDRLAALERKVAALELRHLYTERKAEERTPSVQAFNLKELNENMTILLGIASDQEEDIKSIKNNLGIIKEQVSEIKQDNAAFYVRFDRMGERFDSLENRFDRLEKLLLDRLPPSS